MAQPKVTEFFSLKKKRRTDFQPSKRQKIRACGDLTVEECAFDTEVLKPTESQNAKHSVNKRLQEGRVKAHEFKSVQSKKLVSPSEPNITESANELTPPKLESFQFTHTTVLPSEADVAVTKYSGVGSPHSTPTKRKPTQLTSSVTIKRKRKPEASPTEVNPSATPDIEKEESSIVDKSPVVLKGKSPQAKKKLEMTETLQQVDNSAKNKEQESALSDPAPSDHSQSPKPTPSNSLQLTKKNPSASEIKSLLSRCGRLAELKSCLQKCQEMSKAVKGKTSTKHNTSDQVSANTVSVEDSTIPAAQKYKDLSVKVPPTLTLPYKYKILDRMFKSADTVVSIMHNRLERCTFNKLKRAVQNMLRKNFEPEHLGQIMAVYPESYDIKHEKGLIEAGIKSNKYQMTIEANIDAENEKTRRKDGRPVFGANEVIRRKDIFRNRLYDIVKEHHQKFLDTLNPPAKVDSAKLTHWHPQFHVDNIPDVKPAELPRPPDEVKRSYTAREILNEAVGKLPKRVELALKKVAETTEAAEKLEQSAGNSKAINKSASNETGQPKPSKTAAILKGVCPLLVERIRDKQALKAQAVMLRDEDTERELSMLERLPEMMGIVRAYFVMEKRPALLEDKVVVSICKSCKKSISQASVEKHVDYMVQEFPEWISRVKITSGKYLKIDKERKLTTLYAEVKKLLHDKQKYICST